MVWLVVMSGGKHHFWLNGCIQRIHVCETFVDYGQRVTHQTQIKLSLQVQNACNIQNVNQRNICRAFPTGDKPNKN